MYTECVNIAAIVVNGPFRHFETVNDLARGQAAGDVCRYQLSETFVIQHRYYTTETAI